MIKKTEIPTEKDEYKTIDPKDNIDTNRKMNSIKSLLEQEGFYVNHYYHHTNYTNNIFFISWQFGYKHNEEYEYDVIAETGYTND